MELTQTYLGYGNSYLYNYISDGLTLADWQRLLNAAKIAHLSPHRFSIGAVVHRGRKPLATAVNIRKTSPHLYPKRESIHAEISALNKLADPSGTTVYIARLDKAKQFAVAKPCLYCLVEMQKMGVSRVVFTLNNNAADSFHLNMIKSDYLKD